MAFKRSKEIMRCIRAYLAWGLLKYFFCYYTAKQFVCVLDRDIVLHIIADA